MNSFKGYGFVWFAKRDYANTAKRQNNGIEVGTNQIL
jgi:RNA recognition motif-containing protein